MPNGNNTLSSRSIPVHQQHRPQMNEWGGGLPAYGSCAPSRSPTNSRAMTSSNRDRWIQKGGPAPEHFHTIRMIRRTSVRPSSGSNPARTSCGPNKTVSIYERQPRSKRGCLSLSNLICAKDWALDAYFSERAFDKHTRRKGPLPGVRGVESRLRQRELRAGRRSRARSRAEAGGEAEDVAPARRCPRCGGRMIIAETFEGPRPARPPSPSRIRIDTS